MMKKIGGQKSRWPVPLMNKEDLTRSGAGIRHTVNISSVPAQQNTCVNNNSVSDPYSLNPDPAKNLYPDPDPEDP